MFVYLEKEKRYKWSVRKRNLNSDISKNFSTKTKDKKGKPKLEPKACTGVKRWDVVKIQNSVKCSISLIANSLNKRYRQSHKFCFGENKNQPTQKVAYKRGK